MEFERTGRTAPHRSSGDFDNLADSKTGGGLDADEQAKPLIDLAMEGAFLDAYLHRTMPRRRRRWR
jgi:hypothetical protein